MVNRYLSFRDAFLKIEWAEQHIRDLESELSGFSTSDMCELAIEEHSYPPRQYLLVEIKKQFPQHLALILGDALHNLRSALDLAWYVCSAYFDTAMLNDAYIKFPIFDTKKEFEDKTNGRVKKTPAMTPLIEWVARDIKPYDTGNYALYGLNDLDTRDKHQLLIPIFDLIMFDGICLKNDEGATYTLSVTVPGAGGKVSLDETLPGKINLEEYGRATATILFGIDYPFPKQPVVETLRSVAEEVRNTLHRLDLFLAGDFDRRNSIS